MKKLLLTLIIPLVACAPKTPVETAPDAGAAEAMTRPKPAVGPLPAFTPPPVQRAELASGAELWLVEDHLLPLVSVRLVMAGGSEHDPAGKWGRTALTAAMMNESAGGMSTIERAGATGLIAADLGVGSDRESITVGLDVSTERLERGLDLMADAVLAPDFREEDWERVQRLHVNGLKAAREDAPALANEVARMAYWGKDAPRGGPNAGTPESAASISLEEVRAWYAEAVVAKGASFVVVGDVTLEEAKAHLDTAFQGWGGGPLKARDLGEAPRLEATRFVFVDMPGAAQTAIRVMGPGFAADAEDAAGARLAGTVIGGSFTSRLNNLLREQKGYTYGAGAGFAVASSWGNFVASTSVRTDATTPALTDLLGVLKAATGPFTETEVGKARAQRYSRAISPMESRAGVASTFADLAAMGLSPEQLATQIKEGLEAGEGEMRLAARKYINPDQMVVVLVGDKAAVMADLNEAGYTFEEMTVLP